MFINDKKKITIKQVDIIGYCKLPTNTEPSKLKQTFLNWLSILKFYWGLK